MKSEVFVHALEEKDILCFDNICLFFKTENNKQYACCNGNSRRTCRSAIRVSLSYYNTIDEVKKVLSAVEQTVEGLRKVMK